MKDWMKDLNDEEIKRLFRDDGALAEVPAALRERVLALARDPKTPLSIPRPARRRLKPALALAALAAAAIILIPGVLLLGPLLLPGGDAAGIAATAVPDRDLEQGYAGLAYDQGFVVYAAGAVDIGTNGGWKPAAIGAYLRPGERIRTGESSSCEIQFGDRAIVVIEERTEVLIETLDTRAGAADIGLSAQTGSLLHKVGRLGGGESFRVRTPVAVCGVRGTKFRTAVADAGQTTVTVSEGSVYVLPGHTNPEALRRRGREADVRIAERIDRLTAAAPAITRGKEIALTGAFLSATRDRAEAFRTEMDRALAAKTTGGADLARLDRTVAEYLASVKSETPAARPLSAAAARRLDWLDRLPSIPVWYRTATTPSPVPPAGPALVRIELTTEPADAMIHLYDLPVGRGRFQGLAAEGVRFEFDVQRAGYETSSLTVNVSATGEKSYTISLPSLPEKTDKPLAEEKPAGTVPSVLNGVQGRMIFVDDFTKDTLDKRWSWQNEDTARWSLTKNPDSLTIDTQYGEIYQDSTNARNILLTPCALDDFILETKIVFSPKVYFQQAGLMIHWSNDNFLKLAYVYGRERTPTTAVEYATETNGEYSHSYQVFNAPTVYLRLEKRGNEYTGWVSGDGKHFQEVSRKTRNINQKPRVGLCAFNSLEYGVGSVPAAFDYFALKDTSQKDGSAVKQTPSAPFPMLVEHEGHRYYLSRETTDWHTAKRICEQNGGHLATITSSPENQTIIRALRQQKLDRNVWIGLANEEHGVIWKWVTGDKLQYNYWDVTEPNNLNGLEHWAAFWVVPRGDGSDAEYHWVDLKKDDVSYFIMEIDPPTAATTGPAGFREDFNGPALDARWRWVRENPARWSLKQRPGFLTITTELGELRKDDNNTKNIMLHTPEGDYYTIETRVTIAQRADWQQAGLIIYANDDDYLKIDPVFSGNRLLIEMSDEKSGIFNESSSPVARAPSYYLRLQRQGEVYSGWYSTDGKNFTLVRQLTLRLGSRARLGLFAMNGASGGPGVQAAFDYFKLTYDR